MTMAKGITHIAESKILTLSLEGGGGGFGKRA